MALAALTLVFGIIGWHIELGWSLENTPEVFIRSIQLFVPSTEVFSRANANYVLLTAVLLGGAFSLASFIFILFYVLSEQYVRINLILFRRGHTIILGDTQLSDELAKTCKKEKNGAVQVVSSLSKVQLSPYGVRRVEVSNDPQVLQRLLGLNRAKNVIIDYGTDSHNWACAKPLIDYLCRNMNDCDFLIAVRVIDHVMTDLILEQNPEWKALVGSRLVTFDENGLLAQFAFIRNPLFIRAAARGQDRVHAVIIGFGDLGEKVMDQVVLTSVAGKLKMPMITILDPNSDKLRLRFQARRPYVASNLGLNFIDLEVGVDPIEDVSVRTSKMEFLDLEARHPVTAFLLALPSFENNLRAALILERLQARTGKMRAPIFLFGRYGDRFAGAFGENTLDPAADTGKIKITLTETEIMDAILDNSQTDVVAKRLHDSYLRSSAANPAAAKQWKDLSLSYRRANRRAADHVPAKLWSVGIDPAFARSGKLPEDVRSQINSLLEAGTESPTMRNLVRIEHERWMLDRYLDGWRYGPARDEKGKINPMLVPYSKMRQKKEEIEKDLDQIKTVFQRLLNE